MDKISLDQVEKECSKNGLRFTSSRQEIMSVLVNSRKPKSAYQILEKIQKNSSSAKPATVYRGLDFLCKHGFAHRIESNNAYVACASSSDCTSAQFLICESCDRTVEFHSHKFSNEISEHAKKEDFIITHKMLEIKGICRECT